jgi:cold shock CspA family protein
MDLQDSNTETVLQTQSSETQEPVPVLDEVPDVENMEKYIGQCKWFSDKLGYGFLTVCDGEKKGMDIFSHHSGIKPLNSNYKTLKKGEYIQFNIVNGINGLQAINVTGINGGPLMCDFVTTKKVVPLVTQPSGVRKSSSRMNHDIPESEWQQVSSKRVPSKKLVTKYNKNKVTSPTR